MRVRFLPGVRTGCRPVARPPALGAGERGFESFYPDEGSHRLTARTRGFQPWSRGSTPLGSAKGSHRLAVGREALNLVTGVQVPLGARCACSSVGRAPRYERGGSWVRLLPGALILGGLPAGRSGSEPGSRRFDSCPGSIVYPRSGGCPVTQNRPLSGSRVCGFL